MVDSCADKASDACLDNSAAASSCAARAEAASVLASSRAACDDDEDGDDDDGDDGIHACIQRLLRHHPSMFGGVA